MKWLLITALAIAAILGGKPAHAEDVLTAMARAYDREQQISNEDFEKKYPDWRKSLPKDPPPPPPQRAEIDPKLTAEDVFADLYESDKRLVLWKVYAFAPVKNERKFKTAGSLTDSEVLRFKGLMRAEELTELVVYKHVCNARGGIMDAIETRWQTLPAKLRDTRLDYIQRTVEESARSMNQYAYDNFSPVELRNWKPEKPSELFCSIYSGADERHEFDHIYKAIKEEAVK